MVTGSDDVSLARYGDARLMRAGLGNMLFPWARCFLWCRDNGAAMLAPRWLKFRIGPYLRREPDKRRYDRLFRHHGYIHGMRRAAVLARAEVVPEGAPLSSPRGKPTVVRFEGLGEYFAPLVGRGDDVADELRRISRPGCLPPPRDRPFLGVHVRLGDFDQSWRQPLDWYSRALRALRDELGADLPARLYSDGTDTELAPITSLPDVEFVRGTSAVTDILDLAQAAAIVASTSTFSMWGTYLGTVPTLWYPERLWQRCLADPGLEAEWDARGRLAPGFVAAVAARLS